MKTIEIIEYLESIFPLNEQEEWDNCGLLVEGEEETGNILLSLSLTKDVIKKAIEMAKQKAESDRTLRLIAFILNIVSTVSVGWLLIPLAWMIPMTVISYGIYKGTKKNTSAFGVCTSIFVNLVSGILLLVSRRDD